MAVKASLLDFPSMPKTLPESFAWDVKDPIRSDSRTGSGVPVIDLGDPNAVAKIREACERLGAFQVTNHGVSGQLFRAMEEEIVTLFELPKERKLAAARPSARGIGYGVPAIGELFPKLMWSEGFLMMGSPDDHARRLWPNSLHHRHFTDVMMTYQNELGPLYERMMGLIIESLGLSEEDTKWAKPNFNGLSQEKAFLQLNSYPVCPDPTRAISLAPHTDSSMITFLYQSNGVDGLQIFTEDEEGTGWMTVHPVNGALVVLVGDLLHFLSNGRYKNALHRAVPSATRNRISIVYFCGPQNDVEVSPLDQLTDVNNPPLFRSVTWNSWRNAKQDYLYDAFDLVKIKN